MPDSHQTLSEIEAQVGSFHQPGADADTPVDAARDEVNRALNAVPSTPEPIQALNAQPFGDSLHVDAPTEQPLAVATQGVVSQPFDPSAPPPVPPPIPFNFNAPPS